MLSLTTCVLALAGGASTALAGASGGGSGGGSYSTKSVSLTAAVGSGVAGAVGNGMGSTGWSWGLGSGGSGGASKRGGEQSAESWLASNVNLYNGKISSNPGNVVLTSDPAGGGGQVLSVKYGANSYGLHTTPSGGTSFYSQPFVGSGSARSASNPFVASTHSSAASTSASRNEMLLSYSVYFPDDFDFVKGGKLPGLYASVASGGGSTLDADTSGCEGGSEGGIGTSCWSTRIMWRQDGQAEIYAYIPTSLQGTDYKLCPADSTTSTGAKLICNSDYGTSIGRGSFTFQKGKWNDLALHVKLNSAGKADGMVQLFFNGGSSPAIHLENIAFLGSSGGGGGSSSSRRSLARRAASNNWVSKIMWTSFFGGSGSEWATPNAVQTYFKNVALFAGSGTGSSPAPSGGSSNSSSSSSSGSASSSGSGSAASSGSSSGSGSGSGSSSGASSSASAAHHSHHSNYGVSSAATSSGSGSGPSAPSSSSSPASGSKGGKCARQGRASGGSQRRRSSRAERDAAVQARAQPHHQQQPPPATKRWHHRRSPNYLRGGRHGEWA